ncbi:hypothetical protein [Corynebacterium diphtheriae]|uniref:hypothetical protein n=1 Tax=Corynebacterium diphtheriae TaxID=1717 RepID=UPI000B4B1AB5|nr:hypothetical protein [Corynebacterium diphtheriae]OWN60102.1 hypothetical protein AY506_03700 [Corynebacterium diphtheriae bv. mitis]
MFKRSLASLAAVAVVSGAVVAPANAVTVTVNNDMCTFNFTDEEAGLLRLHKTVMHNKTNAANIKMSIVEPQLSALRAQIEKDEKKLNSLEPGAAGREKLTSDLKENKEKFTAYKNFSNALKACIDGNNYNSKHPDGSDQPGGPSNPGPSNPGPSKPERPNNPERKRALPSTNGAVIGAIVAVLGILAAALPFIKSMLPAQLRALLP